MYYKRAEYERIRTLKLNFEGVAKEFNVYRVPISTLHFNMQNGRIGTYISKYYHEHGEKIEELLFNDKDNYNKLIAEYIKDSDKGRFKDTKENIAKYGQMNPGVILTDGTVIDGNRRFTALNELYKETGNERFGFFETVILETPEKGSEREKSIKRLEIEIQIGIDEKVEYSPIQRLVDIYKVVVSEKLLTDEEYRTSANWSKSKYEDFKERAMMMVDFCSFFNVDEQFHLVEELKLDGPIAELNKVRKQFIKNNDEQFFESTVKPSAYNILLIKPEGDITRDLRAFLKISEKEHRNFLNNNYLTMETIHESTINMPKGNEVKIIQELKNSEEAKVLSNSFLRKSKEVQIDDKKSKSRDYANSSLKELQKIDKLEISFMDDKSKAELKRSLNKISTLLLTLFAEIDKNDK